jgi:hypothetical protein
MKSLQRRPTRQAHPRRAKRALSTLEELAQKAYARQAQELASLRAFLPPEYRPDTFAGLSGEELTEPSRHIQAWLSGDPEQLYQYYLKSYGTSPDAARARVELRGLVAWKAFSNDEEIAHDLEACQLLSLLWVMLHPRGWPKSLDAWNDLAERLARYIHARVRGGNKPARRLVAIHRCLLIYLQDWGERSDATKMEAKMLREIERKKIVRELEQRAAERGTP